jgi:hypothetical protein
LSAEDKDDSEVVVSGPDEVLVFKLDVDELGSPATILVVSIVQCQGNGPSDRGVER